MDLWASLEHKMKYKKQVPNAEELTRELKVCAEMSARLDERMQSIHQGLMGD